MITYLGAVSAYNQMQQNIATGKITPVTPPASSGGGEIFAGMLNGIVGETITSLRSSEKVTAAALVDKASLHDVITKVNQADIALQTVIAIRDKVISAYQDIIRMPV